MRSQWLHLTIRRTVSMLICICVITRINGDADNAKTTSTESTPSKQETSQEGQGLSAEDINKVLTNLVEEHLDTNKDKYVTHDELQTWLNEMQQRNVRDNVERQWEYYEPEIEAIHSWEGYQPEQKAALSWEKYKNLTYPDHVLEEESNDVDGPSMKEMEQRAKRRWEKADENGDGLLTKEEFKDFLHPEESERTKELIVQETIDDMDRDKNGEVSLEEYMNHMGKVAGEEKNEANWAQVQQNHFTTFLDKNKDGSLNKEEMTEWVLPNYDRNEAEAWRLISLSDSDRDGKLTKDDIIHNHQLFLPLQPPHYWEEQNEEASAKHDEF